MKIVVYIDGFNLYYGCLKGTKYKWLDKGFFLMHPVDMMRADGKGFAKVIKSEEKGTDVNIAAHLLHDAHRNFFEKAVVISNDSDLVSPIRMVKNDIGKSVIVISPYNRNSIQLKEVATSVKRIREGLLRVSQFSESLKDSVGDFNIPDSWR